MSFYSDFILKVSIEAKIIEGKPASAQLIVEDENGRHHQVTAGQMARGLSPFYQTAEHMKASKIIRLPSAQAQVFLDTPTADGQDYLTWLRLPFPRMYIHVDGMMTFGNYADQIENDIADALARNDKAEAERLVMIQKEQSPQIKGILLAELHPEVEDVEVARSSPASVKFINADRTTTLTEMVDNIQDVVSHHNYTTKDIARLISCTFMMPLPTHFFNMHSVNILVMKDGRLVTTTAAQQQVRDRMRRWIIHIANFLSSPSVKLAWTNPSPQLQKKRQASGKAPLPGWYEIIWRKEVKDYSRSKISKNLWHHSYRYDVAGHQKVFRTGPMAGRVIWCPSHQRGLRNTLYKPAVRIVKETI